MGRIYPRGLPEVAWVLHESGYPLLVLKLWPWSHPSLLFITVLRYPGPRPPRPYRGLLWCRPLHGLSYPWVSGGDTVDASTWWRLILVTPQPGDASTWRRLNLATPQVGDTYAWRRLNLLTFLPVWLWLWLWLWFWSTPGDGTVHKPPSLELTTCFQRKD